MLGSSLWPKERNAQQGGTKQLWAACCWLLPVRIATPASISLATSSSLADCAAHGVSGEVVAAEIRRRVQEETRLTCSGAGREGGSGPAPLD